MNWRDGCSPAATFRRGPIEAVRRSGAQGPLADPQSSQLRRGKTRGNRLIRMRGVASVEMAATKPVWPTAKAPTVRDGSKQAQVPELLRRPEVATLAYIKDATGWRPILRSKPSNS